MLNPAIDVANNWKHQLKGTASLVDTFGFDYSVRGIGSTSGARII